ncbi:ATP-binding protein [Clostridioides sp. ZZV14-6345]|uniref:ATP-binding protein n=1 Tax=Clostridioides sp. ZZV14-6345 TaxID=2811496 RepID=UPI001D11EAA4|nr:ATP-binding protein [Clostridioides sp. ZZV14-6345]
MIILGKNIIENLTVGMYEDCRVIYREYIQNSADQIDKAVQTALMKQEDACIDIDIDKKTRNIKIYDNATGIQKKYFKKRLSDIANSEKDRDTDKGFRGIGRLGGIAYCDKLKFSSSYYGENLKSVMIWDAKKCKEILSDKNCRCTAEELLDNIISYEEEVCDEESHFFEVELINVNNENKELMDIKEVEKYLSSIAPVPYHNFIYKEKIYEFINNENMSICEYKISINGKQIFKNYRNKLYEDTKNAGKKSYDEIYDLEFKKIMNSDNELIAWMWFGVSGFIKSIPVCNQMRGIRLRKENIQIGNERTLTHFFREPRGNYYFIGEIHVVSKDLIPNARRDYFNENETEKELEAGLKSIFDELHTLYHHANRIKNAFKKKSEYDKVENEYNKKIKEGGFIDSEEKKLSEKELEEKLKDAEEAKRILKGVVDKASDKGVINKVFSILEKGYSHSENQEKVIEIKSEKIEKTERNEKIEKTKNNKKFMTQRLSNLNRKEQKLVSKIYSVIKAVLPRDTANTLIEKIQEELS